MVRLDGLAFHRAARLNGRYAVRRGRARIWPAQKTSTAAIWTVPCRSGRARAFLDAAVDAMAMDAALTERFERFSVGLTGGIGSGKTVVAQRFAQHGVTVIDTDRIAHVLTAAGGAAMPQITRAFGHTYLTAGGALDRAKMREYIFSNLHARRQLEAILHPLIRIECIRAASAARSAYALFVVPLLVETGYWKNRVDRVLVVDCSTENQIRRVIQRDGFKSDQVQAMIAQQASREARLAQADDVLYSETMLDALYTQIDQFHRRYLGFAR